MCQFFEVSRSGYYDFVKRLGRPEHDADLAEEIRVCQNSVDMTYGYRRVWLWLEGRKIHRNPKTVLRIMKKYGLLSEVRRRRKWVNLGQQVHKYDNLLNRQFRADRPNVKWVTDISYIHTKEGVLYLSMIRDLYDNSIVAYKTASRRTVNLVLDTVEQKRMKLLTYNAQGTLDDADFLSMNKQCSSEAKELQAQLADLTAQQESAGNMKQQLDTIRTVLRNAQKDAANGVITKEFVARYIDKIFATPEGDGALRLDIKIFTGECCEKHLQNLRRQSAAQTVAPQAVAAFSPDDIPANSTGHTFKKMIESYEKNL